MSVQVVSTHTALTSLPVDVAVALGTAYVTEAGYEGVYKFNGTSWVNTTSSYANSVARTGGFSSILPDVSFFNQVVNGDTVGAAPTVELLSGSGLLFRLPVIELPPVDDSGTNRQALKGLFGPLTAGRHWKLTALLDMQKVSQNSTYIGIMLRRETKTFCFAMYTNGSFTQTAAISCFADADIPPQFMYYSILSPMDYRGYLSTWMRLEYSNGFILCTTSQDGISWVSPLAWPYYVSGSTIMFDTANHIGGEATSIGIGFYGWTDLPVNNSANAPLYIDGTVENSIGSGYTALLKYWNLEYTS